MSQESGLEDAVGFELEHVTYLTLIERILAEPDYSEKDIIEMELHDTANSVRVSYTLYSDAEQQKPEHLKNRVTKVLETKSYLLIVGSEDPANSLDVLVSEDRRFAGKKIRIYDRREDSKTTGISIVLPSSHYAR